MSWRVPWRVFCARDGQAARVCPSLHQNVVVAAAPDRGLSSRPWRPCSLDHVCCESVHFRTGTWRFHRIYCGSCDAWPLHHNAQACRDIYDITIYRLVWLNCFCMVVWLHSRIHKDIVEDVVGLLLFSAIRTPAQLEVQAQAGLGRCCNAGPLLTHPLLMHHHVIRI